MELACLGIRAAETPGPWQRSKEFEETSFTATIDPKIRIHVNAPIEENGKPRRATRLIVYALPNGNTLEQTLGCKVKPGMDWHYDIQHVAAQVRLLRTLLPKEQIVLICAEAPGLSWPSFRASHKDASTRIAALIETWRMQFGNDATKVFLTGHSGGGGFVFSMIDAGAEIPAYIDRIAFLDSNYNFDAEKHAKKIEQWLEGHTERRLIVIAYDDREIKLNGKNVVGPTGGTFRATGRMRDAFEKPLRLVDSSRPPFEESVGLDGRVHFYVHRNPENKILHTVLVGEMNGLVHAATLGTPQEEKWGKFGGPRAYTKWIQAAPTGGTEPVKSATAETKPRSAPNLGTRGSTSPPSSDRILRKDSHLAVHRDVYLPARPNEARGGTEIVKSLAGLRLDEREAAILREITSGNFPDFLRDFKEVPIVGRVKASDEEVPAKIDVMPDYLSIGSDADFVRIPMTPQTAQKIADEFGCTLPTRKLVDEIDRAAEIQVAPHPMTKNREAIGTFLDHNQIIEKQRGDAPLGLLLTGAKKDIVLTPRIFEKKQRLAIYGWRQLNGEPIQPLTTVHWNQYVDYSHGVRLLQNRIRWNGKSIKLSALLEDRDRAETISDEGPMKPARYPEK